MSLGIEFLGVGLLVAAIVLGFTKRLNVGVVAMGFGFMLILMVGLPPKLIFSAFPSKLFLTLLGTMFFFALLQENGTLELLAKKIISLVGHRVYLIPIIIYLVSYVLSAAGPGAISVQSVTIIFAVSLAIQLQVSPILLASLAILGAVGGTASPIALTGIIVGDLTAHMGLGNIDVPLLIGVTIVNFFCAVAIYVYYGGYKLILSDEVSLGKSESFNGKQIWSIILLVIMVVAVVGAKMDVGLVCFTLAVMLLFVDGADSNKGMKLIPWGVLVLIVGVSILMSLTKATGGIDLLSKGLASLMNDYTAIPLMGLSAGIMSWFSSANGVVMPTLIPTVPGIIESLGGNVSSIEMIVAIAAGSTVAGISPLSTGGSLVLASYIQGTSADTQVERKLFAKLFVVSFVCVLICVLSIGLGVLKVI